jgi:N-methylhydantoinase B/oxoprolinase/acetone carboxylase alpha subunit
VKASHAWELQINIEGGTMKIDFGGADRWTWAERKRNYEEVGVIV